MWSGSQKSMLSVGGSQKCIEGSRPKQIRDKRLSNMFDLSGLVIFVVFDLSSELWTGGIVNAE
jgi:hypothetical protein